MCLFSGILNDLFDGSQKSDCLLPCTTAHFETKFLNKYASDTSYIDVTFSSEVRKGYQNQFYCGIEHCLEAGFRPMFRILFRWKSQKQIWWNLLSVLFFPRWNIKYCTWHCVKLIKSFVNIKHLRLGWRLSWSLAGSWSIASGPTDSCLCITNLHKMQEEFR